MNYIVGSPHCFQFTKCHFVNVQLKSIKFNKIRVFVHFIIKYIPGKANQRIKNVKIKVLNYVISKITILKKFGHPRIYFPTKYILPQFLWNPRIYFPTENCYPCSVVNLYTCTVNLYINLLIKWYIFWKIELKNMSRIKCRQYVDQDSN